MIQTLRKNVAERYEMQWRFGAGQRREKKSGFWSLKLTMPCLAGCYGVMRVVRFAIAKLPVISNHETLREAVETLVFRLKLSC